MLSNYSTVELFHEWGIKVEKPRTIKPFEGSEKDGVKEWRIEQGHPYLIRSSKVYRVGSNPSEFTRENELKYWENRNLIAQAKKTLEILQQPHAIESKEQYIKKLTEENNEVEEAYKEYLKWEFREIAKCLLGSGTMSGMHYFYYNFVWIEENIKGGVRRAIKPIYRACDDWLFRMIMKHQSIGRGMVGGKRRQFGWSWMVLAKDLYSVALNGRKHFTVSKDEKDLKKFFKRMTESINRLPTFLQNEMGEDSEDTKSFHPNAKVQYVKEVLKLVERGNEPLMGRIRSSPPRNANQAAGDTLNEASIDEIGEIENVDEIWDKVEPALMEGNSLDRAGAFFGMGTVGKMEKYGHKFRAFWRDAEVNGLDQIIIYGWMGIDVDEYGNEDKDLNIKKIRDRVATLEANGNIDRAITYRQKYPLSVEDMFLKSKSYGLWPSSVIEVAEKRLEKNKSKKYIKYGRFVRNDTGVTFVEEDPNPSRDKIEHEDELGYNQVRLLLGEDEPKNIPYKYAYVGGADPITLNKDIHKEVESKSRYMHSDFSVCIYKRLEEVGGISNLPVAFYSGRSADVRHDYEQALCLAIYYNAPINIERNKGDKMYDYFRDNGYDHLIAQGVGQVATMGAVKPAAWGFNNSETWWTRMIVSGIQWWTTHGHQKCFFKRLISESYVIREENTDDGVSFLAALQLSEEIDARDRNYGRLAEGTTKMTNNLVYHRNGRKYKGQKRNNVPSVVSNISQKRRKWTQ